MADEAKAPRGGTLTWLWMILALLVVGGFLVWLGTEAKPSSVAVVETDSTAEEALEPGVTAVPKDTLAADKARVAGQRIRVAQIEATGILGPRIFWGELGNRSKQVPMLIRVDSAAADSTFQVQAGTSYTVTGQVEPMSDSLATAWGDQGEFTGEGEQMQAAFADYYIQASNIRPSRPASPAPGGASGAAAGPPSNGG